MDGWRLDLYAELDEEDQEKFERDFKRLMQAVGKNACEGTQLANVLNRSGTPSLLDRWLSVHDERQRLRNSVMNDIISDKNFGQARGAVVIGVQVERLDYPYSVLARRANTICLTR